MPYAVRLNPDPPAGPTDSDGLKFRMVTSGIRAGALLYRSGSAWVSDRMQTPVCRRRPLPGLEEHDAMNVRSTRTTSAPLSRIALTTADHHWRRARAFAIASKMRVDSTLRRGPRATFYAAGGCGYSSMFSPSASAAASSRAARLSSAGGRSTQSNSARTEDVVKRRTLTPQNRACSIGYSADQRRTHWPNTNPNCECVRPRAPRLTTVGAELLAKSWLRSSASVSIRSKLS